jgi:hypothetical protein
MMAVTPDHTLTIVIDQGANGMTFVDNKTETPATGPTLPAAVSSIAISTDSKTAWFATRNAPVTGAQSGAVQNVDLTTAALGTQISVPLAQTLVMSPDGKKILVFSDQTDQVTVIDTTAITPATTPPTFPAPVTVTDTSSTLSRPVAAVFSSDSSKAYVVSCGPECGGTGLASVSVVDMTATPPTVGATQPVVAGSSILMDSSNNLFVAGTAPGAANGSLTVLTPSAATVTISKAPVGISLGFHTQMVLGADNKLFVGATGCPDGANVASAGCLTIYDTSAGTLTVTTGGAGTVTGMAVVPNSHLVYVVMGGELVTYDTRTSAIFTGPCGSPTGSCFIDIVGQAVDVKIIDP